MGTTISDLFPSNFLKAADLKGQRRIVTIQKVTREEVGKEKKKKAVVYFAESKKGLVLNKTNAVKIAKVTGSEDYTRWPGKKIALIPTEVEFQGDLIPAIRVTSPDGAAPAEDGTDAFSADDDNGSAFADDAREPASGDGIEDSDNPFA
jgi:hypothetical protein